jgi:hypothetical protein
MVGCDDPLFTTATETVAEYVTLESYACETDSAAWLRTAGSRNAADIFSLGARREHCVPSGGTGVAA